MPRAEQLTDPLTHHGEGAVWSEDWGGLRCVDMLAGEVVTIAADGSARRARLGRIAALVRPVSDGRTLVAVEDRVLLWDEENDERTALTEALLAPPARLNEGGCTPDGRLLVGSLDHGRPHDGGALFAIDGAGGSRAVRERVGIANGLGFSPDGSIGYHVDSAAGRVAAFELGPDGVLLSEREHLAFDPADGAPDGLWVDEEGALWIAFYGGSCVRRYRANGRLDEVVEVAARQVTSCTFGGPGLRTLYITSSRENLAPDDDPLAGSLFALDVGVSGLPVLPFRVPETPTPHDGREK